MVACVLMALMHIRALVLWDFLVSFARTILTIAVMIFVAQEAVLMPEQTAINVIYAVMVTPVVVSTALAL